MWQPCELLYTCYLITYLLTARSRAAATEMQTSSSRHRLKTPRPSENNHHTTNFTMKRNAGSLIYINWSGGRCPPGHYYSRANKSATKLSVVRRDARLPQMIACRCLCQSSSSSDGWLLLATGPVQPGLWAPALRSASNCEKEATAEREARDTRRGLAP